MRFQQAHLATLVLTFVLTSVVVIEKRSSTFAGELRVPAFTAYMLPNPESARMSERSGITRWHDSNQSVNWYGSFENTGTISARVEVKLESNASKRLKLTIADKSSEVQVSGSESSDRTMVDFGEFIIAKTGYQPIKLEVIGTDDGFRSGTVEALILSGEKTLEGLHFNMKERRNAASVHLMYPTPRETKVDGFYCEVTAIEDPTTTFYMACGWHRGYFGMQVNSPTERRIIFSVWDSGNEAVDRKNVADENRVKLMGKGEGVYSGDFGNEGTGGHSHLKVMWKTGETQRFFVTAEPVDTTFTIFSGYWFHPEQKKWMLISSWKAPKEGGYLRGLHSFSENFGGSSGHLRRKALYGNQWLRSSDGDWHELTTAKFSHDPTGKADRLDRFMGVEQGQFFLSHGGFIEGFTKYGEAFERPAKGNKPSIELPKP